ncbi:uncharacterized protein LOC130636865 [Hydractinia symbiolongicarpus]|uniref:uncharacterized protein LOC130636865 n=1 Tax=Hydractinia symbiolongicarpus TaxID=13093 RepID=UPI00254A067F|nr:uncharacterized protein LOC130636865 [Hydractinia symbiolongicarpus]
MILTVLMCQIASLPSLLLCWNYKDFKFPIFTPVRIHFRAQPIHAHNTIKEKRLYEVFACVFVNVKSIIVAVKSVIRSYSYTTLFIIYNYFTVKKQKNVYGFGGTIEPESSNVTVTNGNSLVIKWRVNPSAGEAVLTLYVDVLANTTSTILIGLSPALEPDAIKLFGTGRLSATFMGTTYKLMLKNVTYNDTVKFQLLAVFHKDNFTSKRSVVQVTVNGKLVN